MECDDTEEQPGEVALQEPPAPFSSALSALEEHPSSQIKTDTNVKQPRTLSTIDNVLVDKTQPEPEEELEDNFDYEKEAMTEDSVPDVMGEKEDSAPEGVVEMEEELTSAQPPVLDQGDSLEEDKENTPTNNNENEKYVRQVVSQLPLSKIKKLMKMDPDTKLVQNDSVLLVAFATELFIKALSTAAARLDFEIQFSDFSLTCFVLIEAKAKLH